MLLLIQGTLALWVALLLFGGVFGAPLHLGRVTDYNVIVNGGVGVLALRQGGMATYHVKSAHMLGVTLGAALLGAGMVIYGYCPGTGVAAVATGSVHTLVGFLGMLAGGVLYAHGSEWLQANVLSVGSLGKVRLPEVTGVPDWAWLAALAVVGIFAFWLVERRPAVAPVLARASSDEAPPAGTPSALSQ